MLNTCVTSRISLRTRGSSSYSTNDYSYCSNETHPFTYSSSRQCCSCCSYTMYKVPLTPSYCYNLYGLRQSSLIQWSPYRRLIRGGLDRCYNARLPVCDVDGSSFCDRICNFMEKSVGLRKGGLRKCLVYEERSERYDFGGFDEAEAILSLLTDDVDEECFRVTKETRRLVKKPVVEKRENGVVSNKYGSEKKKVDLNDLDSEHRCECGSSVVRSRKKDNRRGEIIRRKEDKEALLREENERVALREEHKIASLKNRVAREKEERGALLRKKSQEAEEKKERESMLRKVRSRTEDREDLLREEHRQKLKKDGSSCSSYYSFSSTGDNESDNEIERAEGRLWLDSSSGHKRNSRSNEIVYEDSKVEDQRHEDYREDNVVRLTKKSTGKELYTGSSVFESDHRKKSEKSFADVSVEEIESRRRISQKESNISVAHENNLKKCSDYYVSYDDTKVKSTGSTKLDQESRQQLRQTDEGVSRQSESRMKYKQLAERQETLNDDVRASYGSQKVYSGKSEMSAKVASSSQETVAEQKVAVGLGTREDRYQRNSRKVAEVSEIQETDITKTSISQQSFETNFKEENYSTNILSSINSATKQQQQQQQQQHQQQQQQQQQQRDQVSALIDSRSKCQQLTKNDAKSILKGESDKRIRKEENMNLVQGSSSESQERRSQLRAKIITNESDESTKILVSGSGNSGAIDIEEKNDTITETPAITPSHSPEIGTLSPWSGAGIATNDVREGSLQFGSTELLGTDPERSSEFHRKASVGAKSKGSQGQPSKFISHEDAIESAALLEKSSAHYVDQFVDQVRNEILISETQREKKTSETKSVHEEQQKQKNSAQYISGDYQPEEQRVLIGDDRRSGRKGPTDEMWSVNEPSNQDPSRAEAPDNASEAGTAIAKRTGRSLWNVFADVVRLRWSPHSESHSSGRKTVERSSPNQSTSSETWFSGHEAEQHEEATEEKEGRSITQGSSGSYQEEKTGSIVEEGSSSSTSEGHLKHVGINEPSSSVILGRVSPPISLPSGGEIPDRSFGGTSSNPIVHFSVPLPSMRMRRSPAMLRGDLEAGEANASKSGMSEQLNSGLVEKQESAINEGELKRRKLQRKDQMAQDRFDEWEDAYRLDAEQRKIDETFMREALLEAQKAADKWEVPVGAVLVHNGKIIARGYNLVEELRDSTAHAEIICIRDASNILKTWRLSETTLYVTLEPCPMCAGAILQARIDVVVWGAPNKLLGADGSWIRLFPSGDGGNSLEQSDKPPAPVHPFHPKIIIRRGVLASECADAMQHFFKLRRKDKKTVPSSSTSASPPTCLPITHRPSSSRFLAKMHNAFNLLFCL